MDAVKILFKSKGIKATSQRVLVYEALQMLGHATVDEVVAKVVCKLPTISVSTIYNILEYFAIDGVISKLYTDNKKLYYDITPFNHHHLHFVNDVSRIEDYIDTELTDLVMKYLRNKKIPDFELQNVKVQLIGASEKI